MAELELYILSFLPMGMSKVALAYIFEIYAFTFIWTEIHGSVTIGT
jgi:hypothetical protein